MSVAGLVQEKIKLEVSDGTTMDAYVSRPDDHEVRDAIIVLQEAFGVNSHIRSVSDRLAQQGYVSIAPELYHRTAPGFEGDYDDFNAIRPHINAMTREGADADLKAAFQWLQKDKRVHGDRICSVGYCRGGRMAFAANAVLPLRAAVPITEEGLHPDRWIVFLSSAAPCCFSGESWISIFRRSSGRR